MQIAVCRLQKWPVLHCARSLQVPRGPDAADEDPGQLVAFSSELTEAFGTADASQDREPDSGSAEFLEAYLHLVHEVPA